MSRSMLSNADFQDKEIYWSEAVSTVNYIQNRLCTRSGTCEVTPFEGMHGRKPDLGNLKIFCCKAFLHIRKSQLKGKFYPRAVEEIFIEYAGGNSCRNIISSTRKLFISPDVDFDEM